MCPIRLWDNEELFVINIFHGVDSNFKNGCGGNFFIYYFLWFINVFHYRQCRTECLFVIDYFAQMKFMYNKFLVSNSEYG